MNKEHRWEEPSPFRVILVSERLGQVFQWWSTPPIVIQSNDLKYDRLLGKDGLCGQAPTGGLSGSMWLWASPSFLGNISLCKGNYVDHSVTDQTSIIRFIEDNWNLGNIGKQSFDVKAGSILNMFNSTATNHYATEKLFLDNSTGLEK